VIESLTGIQTLLLLPAVVGSVYSLLTLLAVYYFVRREPTAQAAAGSWPPVSILKPVHGLEKDLEHNLRSACTLDYPDYQVVFSVQRLDDPALPLLRKLEREFGGQRVTVAVTDNEPVINGKVQNLVGALKVARHDILLISDSDVCLEPGYLKTIIEPFDDPQVGSVCTLYRARSAQRWFEKLELLSYNSDFVINVIFAKVTGASDFCLGCSVAMRREALMAAGGLEPLGEYLVEDFELGRRIARAGYTTELVPYFVDTTIDLQRPSQWWDHQVYWDQNTRAARPKGFAATIFIRAVPFALVFALARGFDPLGLQVLAATLAIRLVTAAGQFVRIGDREGLRSLHWLPVRDLVGVASWLVAICKRSFVWRDIRFGLTRDGRIVPRQA
jgi:ceramide glucosyltransferase